MKKNMTAEEAIDAYTKKFGGWPYFLFMGAADEEIVKAAEEALRSGKEIESSEEEEAVY